jgi:hypothetical protein
MGLEVILGVLIGVVAAAWFLLRAVRRNRPPGA